MTWLQIIADVFAVIRAVLNYMEAAQQRGVGRMEAVSEALTIQAEETRLAQAARFEAHSEHANKPGDDAFDPEFKRSEP